jgi:hypothetical protein
MLYLDIINMIGCEDMSNEYKDEVLKKLSVYCNNFSEEQLAEYEDEIFTERIDKKKRAELELGASSPINPLKMIDNIVTMLNSPIAAIKVIDWASSLLRLD